MGIYIPDMEKPKSCGECDLWSNCFYPKNPYTEQDDYIAPDCPIIDIVTCGECKWWNEETHGCDRNPSVEPWWETDFCSYGERRAK